MVALVAFKRAPMIFTVPIRSPAPSFSRIPKIGLGFPGKFSGHLHGKACRPYDKWRVKTSGAWKLAVSRMFNGQDAHGGFRMTAPTNRRSVSLVSIIQIFLTFLT
jgi:hypothetical protein